MLNVALVGLLAGTLAIGGPDGGGDGKKPTDSSKPSTSSADTAVPGIFTPSTAPTAALRPVQDTYAFGIRNAETPIRFWAQYAQGEAEGIWNTDGETAEVVLGPASPIGSRGDLVTRRAAFGAELALPVSLFGFGIAAGGQIQLAQNQFMVGEEAGDTGAAGIGDLESDFGLQGAKVYGAARTSALGLHGGYIFDLGSERELAASGLPESSASSAASTTTSSSSRARTPGRWRRGSTATTSLTPSSVPASS